MKRFLTTVSLVLLAAIAFGQTVGVGKWRDYLSFDRITHVAPGEKTVYASAPMGLMRYDRETDEATRLNKTNGLSDVGIATIAYNEDDDYLLVAYNNSNLDILHKGRTHNLSDIKRSDIPGDKSIHRIKFADGNAYLACGFGLVVVDLRRLEIKETYYLGEHGSYAPVYDVAFDAEYIYAATGQGVLRARKDNPFLNIVDNWTSITSPLSGKTVMMLEMADGNIAAAAATYDPSLLEIFVGNSISTLAKIDQGDVRSIRLGKKLAAAFDDQVKIYDPSGGIEATILSYAYGEMDPHDAVADNSGRVWVGHEWGGLIEFDLKNSSYQNVIRIQGPATDDVYRITPTKHRFFVAPGGKKSTNESLYHTANVYTFTPKTSEWNSEYWQQVNIGLASTFDVLEVAVDPRDSTLQYAVAWGSGVLKIKDNELVSHYDEATTPAFTAYTDGSFRSLRVGSLAFDKDGSLWVTNSLAKNGLVSLSPDGTTWKGHNTQQIIYNNKQEIDRLIIDRNGYKWIIGKENRIYVCDGTYDGDVLKTAYVDPNNGSKMETHTVNCIVEDLSGEIWIGTDKGIKVIYDGYNAFKNGTTGQKAPCSCSNILFSEDGVDEYLMAYESITCIAVDGADRKWIGTANNGIYLISANGQEQLAHFTAQNSPLFSNKITTIAIRPNNGEVLIGTDYGLQSYRGTATTAPTYVNDKNIHAFPNPVHPDYDGPVSVKGFSRNALVHITDASGHVVCSGTADGGQFVWNQRTNEGQRVASGIYFVLASDDDGQFKAVSKILVIR